MEEKNENIIMLESLRIKYHDYDLKINALNILAVIKIKDYLKIANTIKNNNDLQRKRVGIPSTVYALLKDDLKVGCLIPTIVLALDSEEDKNENFTNINYDILTKYIQQNAEKLKILDGLQRTNILIDLENELKNTNNKKSNQLRRATWKA